MKKRREFLKKAFIIIGIIAMLAMPVRAETIVGTVTAVVLDLRAGPSTENGIVGRAYEGDRMLIVGEESGWYKVYFNSNYCYGPVEYFTVADIDSEEYNYKKGKVNASSLYLRTGPGSSYSSIKLFPFGTEVIILNEDTAGWYKVSIGTDVGYMASPYISVTFDPADYAPVEMPPDSGNPEDPDDPGAPVDEPPVVRTCTIAVDVLNLRSGPSTEFEILDKVYKGETYAIYEELSGWYKIMSQYGYGYVSSEYVTVSDDNDVEVKVYGVVNGSVLNLRAGPSVAHALLAQLPYGTRVEVLKEAEDGWYKVVYDGQTGYVSGIYLQIVENETEISDPVSSAIVISDSAGLFAEGSEDSELLATLSLGIYVDVYDDRTDKDGWVIVKSGETLGYIRSASLLIGIYPYVRPEFSSYRLPDNTVSNMSDATSLNTLSPGERIAAYAKTFIGVPYLYGGYSPKTGFDCSGFTWYVFNTLGFSLPRMNQYDVGTQVTFEELSPGDLVFFNTTGYSISHVGIYVGDGVFIHSPSTGQSVCLTSIFSDYYITKFVTGTRIT